MISGYLFSLMLIFSTDTAEAEPSCASSLAQLYYLHFNDPATLGVISTETKEAIQQEVIPSEWEDIQKLLPKLDGSNSENRELIAWKYATNSREIADQVEHLKTLLKSGQQDGTKDLKENKGFVWAWNAGIVPVMYAMNYPYVSTATLAAIIPQMIRLILSATKKELRFKPYYEFFLNLTTSWALIYSAYQHHQIFYLLAGFWFLAAGPMYLEGIAKKSNSLIKRSNYIYILAAIFWGIAQWKVNPLIMYSTRIVAMGLPAVIALQYWTRILLSKKSMWMKKDLASLYSEGRFSENSAAYQDHIIEVDSELRRLLSAHFQESKKEFANKILFYKGKIVLHLHQLFFEKILSDAGEPRLASIFELEFIPQK